MSHPAPAASRPAGPAALTRSQIVAWRNAVFVIFALSGVGMASWVARTPAIRDALGASTFQMGLIVFGAGRRIDRRTDLLQPRARPDRLRRHHPGVVIAAGLGLAVTGLGATHGRQRRGASPGWRCSGSGSARATSR